MGELLKVLNMSSSYFTVAGLIVRIGINDSRGYSLYRITRYGKHIIIGIKDEIY